VELSDTALHVTDTVLLGRVGTTELAAIGLADSALEVAAVPAVGVAGALQILVAQQDGRGDPGAVRAVFRAGLLLILVLGLAVAVAVSAAATPLSGLLTADPAVAEAIAAFLRPAGIGVLFFALGLGFASFYVGLARTPVLLGATAVLLTVNLVLGYGLVLGELGMPELGIAGAGWALLAAEVTTLAFLALATLLRHPLPPGPTPPARTTLRPLLRTTPGIALQAGVEGLRWLLFFLVIARLGEGPTAAASVVYACYAILLLPSYALGETGQTLSGNLAGQRRLDLLHPVRRQVQRWTYALTAPLLVVALLVPDAILSLFGADDGMAAGAESSLRVVALAMLAVVPAEIWSATLAGVGDVDGAFYVEVLLSAAFVGLAAVAVLALDLPAAMAWLGLGVASAVSVPVAAARFRRATARV
jgi:MATE family multidrug resistance protein